MKQVIKLKESQLRKMIEESLNHVLLEKGIKNKKLIKEASWYGNIEPLKQIAVSAELLMNDLEYTQDSKYIESLDGDTDYNGMIYEWAKKVMNEAEEWIGLNSSNMPIGNGQY